FGFRAFPGIISLIGVIVSHVIVLFDFIEEKHEEGEPLREALIDAGIVRLRPVLITVGATVFALFPLAAHGGPLWEPLCYTHIGGLTAATSPTLLIVPRPRRVVLAHPAGRCPLPPPAPHAPAAPPPPPRAPPPPPAPQPGGPPPGPAAPPGPVAAAGPGGPPGPGCPPRRRQIRPRPRR